MTTSETRGELPAFTIEVPNDGAYEVQLTKIGSAQGARLIFTGSNSRQQVNLEPGKYLARAKSLGDGVISSFALELTPNTPDVSLEGQLRNQYDGSTIYSAQVSIRPRPSDQLKLSSPPTANNAFQTIPKLGVTDLLRLPGNPSIALTNVFSFGLDSLAPIGNDLSSRYPGFKGERFAIALSQRDKSSSDGWQPATSLSIDTVRSSTGLTLRIDAFPDARRKRVRLSMSIEGKPTVHIPVPLYRGGILVYFQPFSTAAVADVAVHTEPMDTKASSLLGALSQLPASDAVSVVEWIAEGSLSAANLALLNKSEDLWLATVAGLILARASRFDKKTKQWALNLARLAPHISDTSVLAAWVTAAVPEGNKPEIEAEVLRHLVEAGKRGSLTFRASQSMAVDLLATLRTTGSNAEIRDQARTEVLKLYARATSQLSTSTYLLWEQKGPWLKKGRLPAARYATVAEGRLADGFYDMRFRNDLASSVY